jgi:hypothetical protein
MVCFACAAASCRRRAERRRRLLQVRGWPRLSRHGVWPHRAMVAFMRGACPAISRAATQQVAAQSSGQPRHRTSSGCMRSRSWRLPSPAGRLPRAADAHANVLAGRAVRSRLRGRLTRGQAHRLRASGARSQRSEAGAPAPRAVGQDNKAYVVPTGPRSSSALRPRCGWSLYRRPMLRVHGCDCALGWRAS